MTPWLEPTWWTPERIVAAGAVVQALVLLAAAAFAASQVREARRLRLAQAQPYVVVSLELDPQSPQLVNLVIANLGTTVAKDISVKFDPSLTSSMDGLGRDRRSTWAPLTRGIATLAPGQRLVHLFDSLMSRYAVDAPNPGPRHQATVSYSGDGKRPKRYCYHYDLDFEVWRGSHYVGRRTFDDLTKAVEALAGEVKDARHRKAGFSVAVYDGAVLDAEWESAIEERLGITRGRARRRLPWSSSSALQRSRYSTKNRRRGGRA